MLFYSFYLLSQSLLLGQIWIQIQKQTVMNKKQTVSIIQANTPRFITKNTRTLSHQSSSSSIKGKVNVTQARQVVGKENQSANLSQMNQIKNNENSNMAKGLKRIKQKVQGQSKKQKQSILPMDRYKLPSHPSSKILQKATPKNSSCNKSLLSLTKTPKSILSNQAHSDKKQTPLKYPKQTIVKKPTVLPRQKSKKSEHERSQTSFIKTVSDETPRIQKQSLISNTNLNINLNLKEEENTFIDKLGSPNELIIETIEIPQLEKQVQTKKGLMISMFSIHNKVTQTLFSTTFEVIHIETGFFYCLKVFQKQKIRQQGLEQQITSQIKFRTQITSVKNKSSHKNLQKLFAFFDDQIYIYFVQEFVVGFGSIEKQLQSKRRLSEKEAGSIFKEVLDIAKYIHSQNYIHRDLRMQNLARCLGVIKLVDFSWVACLYHKKQRDTFCGSHRHAPPELLYGQNYNESIDIWHLGIMLYELTTGTSPFTSQNSFIARGAHSLTFPIFLSNECVDLVGRLLSQKGCRMRMQQIFMHEWTNKWEVDGSVSKEIWDFWVLS